MIVNRSRSTRSRLKQSVGDRSCTLK
jgi:hypothetical protein